MYMELHSPWPNATTLVFITLYPSICACIFGKTADLHSYLRACSYNYCIPAISVFHTHSMYIDEYIYVNMWICIYMHLWKTADSFSYLSACRYNYCIPTICIFHAHCMYLDEYIYINIHICVSMYVDICICVGSYMHISAIILYLQSVYFIWGGYT